MYAFPTRHLRRMMKESLWLFGIFAAGIIFGSISIYFFDTPEVGNIASHPLYQTSIFYDRTGTHELYRFYDEENRTVLSHKEIPDSIRHATIATEDTRFYSHIGVDPLAVLRALKADIEAGYIVQGGSTITQQLAKRLFLSTERTIDRKVREMFLAIKIERHTSKDDLLDLYLNAVPYGSNTYGIQGAAETFFGKNASELTIDESALLAILPNAPTSLSPYKSKKNAELVARQKVALDKMHDQGYITEEEWRKAKETDVLAKLKPSRRQIFAPHFVFYVVNHLRAEIGEERLRTEGLRVITTLDYDLQTKAETTVALGAKQNLSRGATNAALVALDPKTGQILTMVGSKDYFDESVDGNVNVTTQARQPGSSFKPIAYAAAFEQGFQPESPLYDIPTDFGPDGTGKRYIPRNYDNRFHGLLTMRQALSMSLNVPAVQTLSLAGVSYTINLAERMGITTLTQKNRYGLALVLGGAEVKPLEMAQAFSVFSQEGVLHPANPILRVADKDGKELTLEKNTGGKRVLDSEIARKINSILSDNQARTPTFGPNSPLAFPKNVQVAAKTGTTQNFRDAWTVGYTSSIAVAVWAGNNDNRPMREGSDGVFVAAPIWRAFMNEALKRFPETGFTPYTRIVNKEIASFPKTIYIDKKTGREITEEEAKDLKKKRVEKRKVEGFSFDFDDEDEEDKNSRKTVDMASLRDYYIRKKGN